MLQSTPSQLQGPEVKFVIQIKRDTVRVFFRLHHKLAHLLKTDVLTNCQLSCIIDWSFNVTVLGSHYVRILERRRTSNMCAGTSELIKKLEVRAVR